MGSEPFAALAAIFIPLAVAAFVLDRLLAPGSKARAAIGRAGRIAVAVGLAWALATAVGFLVVLRPSIGGNDFFYYVCTARDLTNGVPQPDARFTYFPGVYT